MTPTTACAFLALAAAVQSTVETKPPVPQFREDPEPFRASGAPDAPPLRVVTTCGSAAKDYILEVNGGGLALADFDGDGDPDLAVVDGSTLERARQGEAGFPPRLFLNDGRGRFSPAPAPWDMAPGRWGMGCAVGDVNGDGWLDLLLTQWGPNQLFLNRAGQGFEEVTERSGLSGSRWSASAAFGDFDRDGALDLAVANYLAFDPATAAPPGGGCTWKGMAVMCGPEGLDPLHGVLYRGKGDGTFADVTLERGYRPERAGFGLGVTTLDYDLDGDTDLYVANDSTPNHLWENRGDGHFVEVGLARGVALDRMGKEQASMGIGCGDVNGDGRPDLFVTNFSGENNVLYQSRKGLSYSEVSSQTGLGGPSIPYLGWGTALEDFDLDGDLDAFVLNGHVYPQADAPGTDTSYAQVDHFYRHAGGRFAQEPMHAGGPRVSRASACADVDLDGDLDVVGIELDGPVRVYRNRARDGAAAGHWLAVAPRSRSGNRFALGATVRAEWEGGARTAEVRTSGGFQSSVPPEVCFGLGACARVRRIEIRWPSGRARTLEDVAADQKLTVEEPAE